MQKLLAALTTLGLVRPEYAPEEEPARTVAISAIPLPSETRDEAARHTKKTSSSRRKRRREPEPFDEQFPAPPEMPAPTFPWIGTCPGGVSIAAGRRSRPSPSSPRRPIGRWKLLRRSGTSPWDDRPGIPAGAEVPAWDQPSDLEAPEALDRTLQHPVDLASGERRGMGPAIGWILGLLVLAGAAFFVWRSRSQPSVPVAQAPSPTSPAVIAPEATAAPPVVVASPLFEPTSAQPSPASVATAATATRGDGPARAARHRAGAACRRAASASGSAGRAAWVERARSHQRRLAGEPATRFAIQLELACETPTLVDAWKHDRPAGSMWLLPVDHRGRDCFRVLWGRYPSIEAARAAKPRIPSFFVTRNNQPAVVGVR